MYVFKLFTFVINININNLINKKMPTVKDALTTVAIVIVVLLIVSAINKKRKQAGKEPVISL